MFLNVFIWLKYSKICNIVILLEIKITVFYFNIQLNTIYSCDQSWIFSIITPVFSVTWSFRNHNMLICCSRNISDYYQCWKQLLLNIFWKLWYIFSLLLWKKIKRTAFTWNIILCYCIKVLVLFMISIMYPWY